jgi:hypothetical protein
MNVTSNLHIVYELEPWIKRLAKKVTTTMNRSNDGFPVPQTALEKIIRYFHRATKPVYMGFVSAEIGFSLERTQLMLDTLVDEKIIRRLSEDDKKAMKIDVRANVYVLIERPHPSKAYV